MSEKIVSRNKKIVYVSLLVVAILAIGVICALAITLDNKNTIDNDSSAPVADSNSTGTTPPPSNNDGKVDEPSEDVGKEPEDNQPEQPVVQVITFTTPVIGGSVLKEYTDSTVVFSNTLGIYTGHLGIDFGGDENAKVVAAYGGTVKEIYTSYLQGTSVKIDHGNGLVTVYNSIEPIEGLKAGDQVLKGQVIGTISTNNKQEYKDGAHLHFEVWENGVNISPNKYLTVEEK